METLVNAMNPSGSSILDDSANNPDIIREFSSDNINKEEHLNSGLTENPIIQKENEERHPTTNTTSSDKKFPIFNNCHFNNIIFKF